MKTYAVATKVLLYKDNRCEFLNRKVIKQVIMFRSLRGKWLVHVHIEQWFGHLFDTIILCEMLRKPAVVVLCHVKCWKPLRYGRSKQYKQRSKQTSFSTQNTLLLTPPPPPSHCAAGRNGEPRRTYSLINQRTLDTSFLLSQTLRYRSTYRQTCIWCGKSQILTALVCKAPEFFLRVSMFGQITEHAIASSSFTLLAPWSALSRLRTFLFSRDFRFPTLMRASLSADWSEDRSLQLFFSFRVSRSTSSRKHDLLLKIF